MRHTLSLRWLEFFPGPVFQGKQPGITSQPDKDSGFSSKEELWPLPPLDLDLTFPRSFKPLTLNWPEYSSRPLASVCLAGRNIFTVLRPSWQLSITRAGRHANGGILTQIALA